jgi:hypothetical protein
MFLYVYMPWVLSATCIDVKVMFGGERARDDICGWGDAKEKFYMACSSDLGIFGASSTCRMEKT